MQFKKNGSADFAIEEDRANRKRRSRASAAKQTDSPPKRAALNISADDVSPKTVRAKNPKLRSKLFQENFNNTRVQKGVEKLLDNVKMKDIELNRANSAPILTALAGNPERRLIQAGKTSGNNVAKGAAEGLEAFGKLGFRQGATGARGMLNNVVGRTATGKVARTLGLLGTVGVGTGVGKRALRKRNDERF